MYLFKFLTKSSKESENNKNNDKRYFFELKENSRRFSRQTVYRSTLHGQERGWKTNVEIKRTIDEKGKRVKSKDGATVEREGRKIRESCETGTPCASQCKCNWPDKAALGHRKGKYNLQTWVSRQNTIFIACRSHAVLDSCLLQWRSSTNLRCSLHTPAFTFIIYVHHLTCSFLVRSSLLLRHFSNENGILKVLFPSLFSSVPIERSYFKIYFRINKNKEKV